MNEEWKKIVDKRKIKKIFFFHTDHFEPHGSAAKRMETEDEFVLFLKKMCGVNHGRKMSLHSTMPIYRQTGRSHKVKDDRYFCAENDKFEFGIRKRHLESLREWYFPLIREYNMDHQCHIHHERFTMNSEPLYMSTGWGKLLHSSENSLEKDSHRFDNYIHNFKKIQHELGARDFNEWTFIHGCWALNGSDDKVCKISDEIKILRKHGCLADFSFPAGRRHCDPKFFDIPYVIKTVDKIQSYNRKENMIRPWDGKAKIRQGEFMIWASGNSSSTYSLDFYTRSLDHIPKNSRISRWLKSSPIINNSLYVKTHAHSADRFYINKKIWPLNNPYINSLFELLEKFCEKNNIDIEYTNPTEMLFKGRLQDED